MPLHPAENEHERIIPKAEAVALRRQMALAWGVDRHYWWPLTDPRPPHAEGFQEDYFETEFGYVALRRILAEGGVSNVLEFREDGEAYEIKVASFDPCYTGLEGFWTSARFDWILYASHESSITVGGEWLLRAVKAAWPAWEQRLWGASFPERPQD